MCLVCADIYTSVCKICGIWILRNLLLLLNFDTVNNFSVAFHKLIYFFLVLLDEMCNAFSIFIRYLTQSRFGWLLAR